MSEYLIPETLTIGATEFKCELEVESVVFAADNPGDPDKHDIDIFAYLLYGGELNRRQTLFLTREMRDAVIESLKEEEIGEG